MSLNNQRSAGRGDLPLQKKHSSGIGSPAEPAADAASPAMFAEAAATDAAIKRSKAWQLEARYHCPVIGTCLTVEELVKFARRFDFSGKPDDVYTLHVEAVGHAKQRNEVSEAIQRHLDRKYAAALARFESAKTNAAVRALWDAHATRGEVAAAMWAVLTHKRAEEDTRRAVYAEVHMLSHQVGAGQAADLRRLAHLEHENGALRTANAQLQSERLGAEAQASARLQALQHEVELCATTRQPSAKPGSAWLRLRAAPRRPRWPSS
jgi:hypothetical protein